MAYRNGFDVVVLGGGLAGLTAAAVAADPQAGAGHPRRVLLLDTRSVGGRARTTDRVGFAFNEGPHALYRGGAGRAVLARLGITPTGGPPGVDGAKALRAGALLPLPVSARSLATTTMLGLRGKAQLASLLARLGRIDTDAVAGLSVTAWLDDLDLRPDARGVAETLLRVATYADDFAALSADAGVRQLQLAVGQGVDYLDHGWHQLVEALTRVAVERGVTLRTNDRALALHAEPDGSYTVDTVSSCVRASAVVVAVGSPDATRGLLPLDPGWELGRDSTAACLDLGVRHPPSPPVIFGVDAPLYLSTHCPPARLAPPGQAVVHLLRYGARTAEADAAELWGLAATAGITDADVVTHRFLRRMVVAHGLPRPGSGLTGRPAVGVPGLAGVTIAGDWVGPTGMLADASLASAEVAGRAAAGHADAHRASVRRASRRAAVP
ncbi:MAG TPA: FAD-dependent oxidoreductase [Acidimicrobiales bacterium]|nr:FAD-dependent oxidoreductase [Acidimicrobiales bacterium]